MRWWRLFCAFAAPSVALAAARAETPEHADFALDFSGAPGCPSEEAFEQALRARLPEARRVPEGAGVPLLRVKLRFDARDRHALWLSLPDGTRAQREVSDAACSDAVQSMAVIAAMALEASQSRQKDEPSSSTSASPLLDAGPPPGASALSAPPPLLVPTAASASSNRALPAPGSDLPVRPARRVEPWRGTFGALGGVAFGVAPNLAPLLALDAEFAALSSGFWAPSVRLSALLAESSVSPAPSAEVRFRLLAGRLEFCPAWVRRARWAVTGCLEAELGQLRASASGVNRATTQSMPWFGLGLTGRGELALSPAVALTGQGLARAQIVHDRFLLEPSRTVYQVPGIAGEFMAGLSVVWH